jgi:hypothetical protein
MYVLNEEMEPVPIGVAGELYIGGVGLARGYLKRPSLTAERFVPAPFGSGERLYRTGDLVRYRLDGNLEFLGRLDHQVKIRGFRIELGEIEAVLLRHASVRQAVVVAQPDGPHAGAQKRLVGYVVGASGVVPQVAQLRDHLKESLPEYMVPSAFVVLAELPLTPNGKLNRKALPAPELAQAMQQYVAPRTPVEEVLVEIWSEVLNLPRVGIEDNFFELGGHSLLTTQMTAHVRGLLGVELPILSVFEAPTIVELALSVEELMRDPNAGALRDTSSVLW